MMGIDNNSPIQSILHKTRRHTGQACGVHWLWSNAGLVGKVGHSLPNRTGPMFNTNHVRISWTSFIAFEPGNMCATNMILC